MRIADVVGRREAGLEDRRLRQRAGIANVDEAMRAGFTSGPGLGLGLPGTSRLMDEMDIDSALGRGTTVTIRKWRR